MTILFTILLTTITCWTDACLYAQSARDFKEASPKIKAMLCDLDLPDYTGFNYSTQCVDFRKDLK